MKKVSLIIVLLLLLSGCASKNSCPKCDTCDRTSNDNLVENTKKELEAKLLEYGKLVYENDTWLKGGIEPNTYFMTLKEMSERNNYDISMFINPISKEPCDIEKTRIEFIVKEKTEDKTNYKYNAVLECGFKS